MMMMMSRPRLLLLLLLILTAVSVANSARDRRLDNGGIPRVSYAGCSGTTAYFVVCPAGASSSCSRRCMGGVKYETDINFFLYTFTAAQQRELSYRCQIASENCDENNYGCFASYGASSCYVAQEEEQEDGQEDDDEAENQETGVYYACTAYDENNYVGPYCYDGNIYQGYFMDYQCQNITYASTFVDTYGYQLSKSYLTGNPIIGNRECTACSIPNNAEGNEQGNNNEAAVNYYQQYSFEESDEKFKSQCALVSYAGDRVQAVKGPTRSVISFFASSTIGFVVLVVAVLLLGGLTAACLGAYMAGGAPTGRKAFLRQGMDPIMENRFSYEDAGNMT